jgi:hypothetical protein
VLGEGLGGCNPCEGAKRERAEGVEGVEGSQALHLAKEPPRSGVAEPQGRAARVLVSMTVESESITRFSEGQKEEN